MATFIKICGITRLEDAFCAARCGADAVGMILHADSPRLITSSRAAQIIKALPATTIPVGVFVDPDVDLVLQTCKRVPLACVQLYGQQSLEELMPLQRLRIWRALPITGMLQHELRKLKAMMLLHPMPNLEALVLDTSDPHVAGGSGRVNNWSAVRAAQDLGHFDRLPPIVAAGGLTPTNVADVIRLIRPWGVDVSSGVEDGVKGVKSHEKIEAFIRAVRAVDAEPHPHEPFVSSE